VKGRGCAEVFPKSASVTNWGNVRTFTYSVLAKKGSVLPNIEAASIVPLLLGTDDGAIKLISANDIGAAKTEFSGLVIERAVAENIARQLGPLIAKEKWPPDYPPANTMRDTCFGVPMVL
jgi:hypothetical protein